MDDGDVLALRPSLWAALDQTIKIFGTITALLIPLLLPAILRGDTAAAGAVFAFAEGMSALPALAAAFLPAIRLRFTQYRLDADGIRVTSSIIAKQDQRVAWEKVTAIRHHRGLIDAVLGISRVDVVAYGARGTTLHLVGLRDGARLRQLAGNHMREGVSADAWLQRAD